MISCTVRVSIDWFGNRLQVLYEINKSVCVFLHVL